MLTNGIAARLGLPEGAGPRDRRPHPPTMTSATRTAAPTPHNRQPTPSQPRADAAPTPTSAGWGSLVGRSPGLCDASGATNWYPRPGTVAIASAPRSRRNVAIWTWRLPSSTVTLGQTRSRSSSLETTRSRRSIKAIRRSNARAPIFAGSPSIRSRRRAGSTTILPNLCWKASSMARLLPRGHTIAWPVNSYAGLRSPKRR